MSVVCDKCGEQLMGAVNRCWNCGTSFARVATDDQPPVRRAPILAAYLTVQRAADTSPRAEQVILAEVADAAFPAQARTPTAPWQAAWKTALRRMDWLSLAVAAFALLAGWLAYRGPLGILFGGVAAIGGLQRIRQRQTWATWIAFLLATVAMNFALLRLMAFLYTATTGADLFIVLFRT